MENRRRRSVWLYGRKVTMEKRLNEWQQSAWCSQLKHRGKGGWRGKTDSRHRSWRLNNHTGIAAFQPAGMVGVRWGTSYSISWMLLFHLSHYLLIIRRIIDLQWVFLLIHSTSWNFQFSSAGTATSVLTFQPQKCLDQACDLVQHLFKYSLFFPLNSMKSGSDLNKT